MQRITEVTRSRTRHLSPPPLPTEAPSILGLIPMASGIPASQSSPDAVSRATPSRPQPAPPLSQILVPQQKPQKLAEPSRFTKDSLPLVMQLTEDRVSSSVDLYMRAGFQYILHESFAVVCGLNPKYVNNAFCDTLVSNGIFMSSVGRFRLADPLGLEVVRKYGAMKPFILLQMCT
ncbi:hypothetical protein C0995_008944, partial [Termitomyces sp. Mi166